MRTENTVFRRTRGDVPVLLVLWQAAARLCVIIALPTYCAGSRLGAYVVVVALGAEHIAFV